MPSSFSFQFNTLISSGSEKAGQVRPWIWYQYDPANVDAPILPIGPIIAAIVVLFVVGGWSAVKGLFAKVVEWRVGWQWYSFVLIAPVLLTLAATVLNIAMGATTVQGTEPPNVVQLVVRFLFIFLWIGLGEEPGWRGFALPRLLQGNTAIKAALILGLIHAVWHLPLYGVEYDASNVLPWGISVFCFSIVICWVYLHTNGSLLMPMLMHASNNTIALVWRMFEGPDQLRLWWIWCGLWVAMTLLIVAKYGMSLKKVDR